MAYEASEIMFAACLLFSDKQLKDAGKDPETLADFMSVAKKKAATGIKFGSKDISDGFLNLMEPTEKGLKDLAVGI